MSERAQMPGSFDEDLAREPEPGAVAEAFPLTCEWCRGAPADHFLVYDYEGQPRQQAMVCGPCAHRTHVLPGAITNWWLFQLAPDDPQECTDD